MRRERLLMPDGRYIIYYTFSEKSGENEGKPVELEDGEKHRAREENVGVQFMPSPAAGEPLSQPSEATGVGSPTLPSGRIVPSYHLLSGVLSALRRREDFPLR